MSLGVAGYLCNTGIGSLIEDLKNNLPVDSHYVIRHHLYGIDQRKLSPMVYLGSGPVDLQRWVSQRSAVIVVEAPFENALPILCYSKRVPLICIVNIDWFNPKEPWVKFVSTFVAPNKFTYQSLLAMGINNVEYIPASVDTEMFQFRQRNVCNQFLFCNGRGGFRQRKGADLVEKAFSEMKYPLDICTQSSVNFCTELSSLIEGDVQDRNSLYASGDVYVAPTRWEGYGLHILEAMACGLPVLTTSGDPMAEYVRNTEWHINVKKVEQMKGPGRFSALAHEPDLVSFKERLAHWYRKSVREASESNRKLIEREYSWRANRDKWLAMLSRIGWRG